MSTHDNHTADPARLLDAMTSAARDDVTDTEIDAAVARFRERLPQKSSGKAVSTRARRLPAWLGIAGAMATLVLAISIVPLLLPGTSSGSAFAQAQAWFADYRTMQLQLVTRQGPTELYRMEVWHERGGATRIELGPVTHIVDPDQAVMLTLGADGSIMTRQSLPTGMPGLGSQEELAWLDELREFRGQAEAVDESRTIDGIDARGWSLALSGTRHTLWVDPADYRPLLLEGALGANVTMETRFVFDAPLPAEIFVPSPQTHDADGR